MKIFYSCETLKDSDLCAFYFMGDMPKRKFMSTGFNSAIAFLNDIGRTTYYGNVRSRNLGTTVCFDIRTPKGPLFIPLLSFKERSSLIGLSERCHKSEKISIDSILSNLTVIKEMDYIIARVKKEKNRVKYHYIEFKPIAPDVFAKPRLRKGGHYNRDCPFTGGLEVYGTIGKHLISKVNSDVIVYPLFERFASASGFVHTVPSLRGIGTEARFAGGYLPCICVRQKGRASPIYEISLEGPFEGKVLATTKQASKVDEVVREQISKAILGLGNDYLHDILTERKWYRCVRRRYTNAEFVEDLQKARAEYAAKFSDVWEMSSAFGFDLTDYDVRYRVWEVCNSIINN